MDYMAAGLMGVDKFIPVIFTERNIDPHRLCNFPVMIDIALQNDVFGLLAGPQAYSRTHTAGSPGVIIAGGIMAEL